MLKPTKLAQAMALAMILPGVAVAEFEISGEAKIEYSVFTKDGQVTGAAEPHESMDAMKSEPSIKLFINSDVGEESAFHAEVLFADDGEAASSRLEGGESYSQYEFLREFYFDTVGAGWDWRLGKQQVVWGTADGIKLLDIINPTDYRELNQNTSEDSRIPVWMINAEKYLDNGSNIQVIVSEARPNFIAGLDADGDSGAPFIFKGVDTITGATNGFLNIAEDMGRTSGVFQSLLTMGGLSGLTGNMTFTRVGDFTALGNAGAPTFAQVGTSLLGTNPGQIDPTSDNGALVQTVFLPLVSKFGNGNVVLDQAANQSGSSLIPAFTGYMQQLQGGLMTGTADGDAFTNTATAVLDINGDGLADTNTINQAMTTLGTMMYNQVAAGMGFDPTLPATVASVAAALGVNPPTATPTDPDTIAFNNAIQVAAITGMTQTSFQDGSTNQFNGTLDASNPTSAFDFMNQTTFGTFNDFVGMTTEYRENLPDSEFNFGIRYKNSTDGGVNYSVNYLYAYDSNPMVNIHWEDSVTGKKLKVKDTVTTLDAATKAPSTSPSGTAGTYDVTTLSLEGKTADAPAVLVFEEELKRVNNLGGSFDMALDTDSVPVVLRGEFLYQAGAVAPVIDRNRLAIGDLTGGLKMEETDYFKYVMGVDITVMTNLLVSTQLIQMFNLDYVDENTNSSGAACGTTANCGRYTGDFSSMSLTNGLNKGDEIETFVSFFLSKPFGSDVQHRWNNIIIAENGGGYWNRFDVEYSFNDQMVGTVEYNKYWGDEDTTFGQFENSSNLQLGFKFIF
jgi:hypothetical protein